MLKRFVSRVSRYLVYLTNYFIRRKPSILSRELTVEKIRSQRLSIARYGDGELKMMSEGLDIHFQDANQHLINDLRRCFSARDAHLLVCVTESLRLFDKNYRRDVVRFYRWQLGLFYKKYMPLLDFSYKYGNANITRFYMDYKTKKRSEAESFFKALKRLWDSRDVLIVEGENTRLGVMTDTLDNATSIKRIICPDKNAYSCIADIKAAIYTHYEDDALILLCLGPTASILATDITVERKYQCLDLGHIDVEYVWLKNKAQEKTPIKNMSSAEAETDMNSIVTNYDESRYHEQIVCSIGISETASREIG